MVGRKAEQKSLKGSGRTALLIEGARRVGKSSLVEEFGRNEYRSVAIIDFFKVPKSVKQVFEVVVILALTCNICKAAENAKSILESLSWRQGDFTGRLYRQFAKDNGNFVFSPYGVGSVCALMATGAKAW